MRRSAEERAKARALGVDRSGAPTARALGINPRELVQRGLADDTSSAARLSAELLRAAKQRPGGLRPVFGRGHGHLASATTHLRRQ